MFIDIEEENGALIDRLEVQADTVPRVGELIHLPEASASLQGAQKLLVVEVCHQLDDGLMEAVVRCRPKE